MFKAAIGGILGGLVGALIWAGIGYFLEAEVGYVALGVGFLVGVGVAIGAGEKCGMGTGLLAIALSLGSVVLGKYLIVYFMAAGLVADVGDLQVEDNDIVHALANELVETRNLPEVELGEDADFDKLTDADFYPPGIWEESQDAFTKLAPDEIAKRKDALIVQRQEIAEMLGDTLTDVGFTESFSGFDILWLLFAAATAFRVGGGGED